MAKPTHRLSQKFDFSDSPCYKCNKKIFHLENINIGDRSLHESCFVCETCKTRLSTNNYMLIGKNYYCNKDGLKQKSIETNKNDEKTDKTCICCSDTVISVEGVVLDNEEIIHRKCFICFECKSALNLGNFHELDGKLYCSRHFFQKTTSESNVNGRKPRDVFVDSLDADPLQGSLSDLEKQEKLISPLPSETIKAALDTQSTKDSTKIESENDKSIEQSDDTHNSTSETEFVDITEEENVTSDTPKDKVESDPHSDSSIQKPDEYVPKKKVRTKKRKEFKFGKKDNEESPRKKTRRKRKISEVSVDDDITEDGKDSKDKQRKKVRKKKSIGKSSGGALLKGSRSKDKDLDLDLADEESEKKKKGKRGLFSLKKRKSSKALKKEEKEPKVTETGSPSLTSYVSSRFRKQKKEIVVVQNKPATRPSSKLPIIATNDSEDDEEISDEELAPLNSDKLNRITKLSRGDSRESNMKKDRKRKPSLQKISSKKELPICFDLPIILNESTTLEICKDTFEEDISYDKLNVPKSSNNSPSYAWTNYEKPRDLPKFTIELPDDVLPIPNDVKENIIQYGYFQPKIINFGIIGVQPRLLDFISILKTTYPFQVEFMAACNLSTKAKNVITERFSSLKDISVTELLHKEEIDWIFIGSMYKDICNNIISSFEAGKNVFCEKPICLSVGDCLKIRDAHKKSGKKFIGGFMWRLVPFYQEICDVLRSNELGKIVSVEINNLLSPQEGGLLMTEWKRNKNESHSILFDTFCLEIDILNWLLESIPRKVGSFGGLDIYTPNNKPNDNDLEPYLDWSAKPLCDNSEKDPFSSKKDIDDHHSIMLEYRNNIKVSCHINTNCAFPQKRILICGVKGTLEGDLYTGTIRYKTMNNLYETTLIQVTPGLSHGGADQQIMDKLMETTNKESTLFDGEELFPSIITSLGLEQARQKGMIIDLEPQWKQLGI